MAATEPLCCIAGINPSKLSREESQLLEAELFIRICDELKEHFKINYKEYLRLIKNNTEREGMMIEGHFFQCVMGDILATKDYSLPGIACHTHIPEEVLYEIAIGRNINPSLAVARKIIELHRSIRPELYRKMIDKLVVENSIVKPSEEPA